MGEEKKVSIYNPFVDAFCEVPLSQAEKLIESVEDIKGKIEMAKVEIAKDEAYSKSVKK